mmetsp:Transcript_13353/g.25071  ORF Transcript_13353/g.25071 Transcript_13353/m.25071 type:complete len:209 (-) Transcript_13353:793-1419(-)
MRRTSAPRFSWDTYRGKPLPTPQGVMQIRQKFGMGNDTLLTEWEKSWCKEFFSKYDKDKSGYIDVTDMQTLLGELKQNAANIGKVPELELEELMQSVASWPKSKENKVSWREFKTNIDSWRWMRLEASSIKDQIDAHYAKAQKYHMSGKVQEAKAEALKALRLEGLSNRSTPARIVEAEREERSQRSDTFLLRTVKPRRLVETQLDII